jgi:N-acetylmuramoyl-L-alanine amidase
VFVSSLSRFAFLVLLCLSLGKAVPAAADDLMPVHLRIGGREVTARTPVVSDGEETYIPLDMLAAVGAEGKLRGEKVLVTVTATKQRDALTLVRQNGKPMLALSDLARLLNANIAQPDAVGDDGKLIEGRKGDTIYLLARVLEARFQDGKLQVVTSFPVPFRVRTLKEANPVRGYIDCLGAEVAPDFEPTPMRPDEKQATKLRAGQNTEEIARIVVELADGVELKEADSPVNTVRSIVAGLEPFSPDSGETPGADTPVQKPDSLENAGKPDARNRSASGNVAESDGSNPMPNRGKKTSRGGAVRRTGLPIEVRGITFSADDDLHVHLDIATSARGSAFVHYQPGTKQLLVDIPNALLRLSDPDSGAKTLHHPLLRGLRAEMAQDTPPMTRLTLDTTRIVGFSMSTQDNKLSLELRVPRNATGVLADKVIVIDPGHGGSSPGATSHGVYEKNITLAIALKLRAALESCGAKVVMTRDRDANVDLSERPRMANEIGADLFISVHNDSTSVPESASGTSTYYHMSDPSSRALALCVQQAVCAVTGLPSRGALSDGVLYASGLAVLRESTMPAILCEVAYINTTTDRRKLTDEDFQRRVARAMCDGIRNYIEGAPMPARAPDMDSSEQETPPQDAPSGEDGDAN